MIGKRYHVKADQSSVRSSVISSSAYISIDKTNDIQYNYDFKPANWMFKPIQETLLECIFDSLEQYNDLFRQTRNQLLSERLALMIGSQEINADNEMQDDINRLVEEKKSAANFKMCLPCKQETPFSQKTCRLCKTKLVKYDVHFNDKASPKVDPYDHFNVKPLENEIDVVVGEPVMLNPSCYQNISKILTFVGERASIDRYCKEEKEKQRKWIFLENDGGIMNPATKLIFNVYRCSRCEEKMHGRENFETHLCTEAFHLAPVDEFD